MEIGTFFDLNVSFLPLNRDNLSLRQNIKKGLIIFIVAYSSFDFWSQFSILSITVGEDRF